MNVHTQSFIYLHCLLHLPAYARKNTVPVNWIKGSKFTGQSEPRGSIIVMEFERGGAGGLGVLNPLASIIIHCSHHLSSHWLKAYS